MMFCMLIQIQEILKFFLWCGMVQNGQGHSGHGTLILSLYKKTLMEQTDFLHTVTNSG